MRPKIAQVKTEPIVKTEEKSFFFCRIPLQVDVRKTSRWMQEVKSHFAGVFRLRVKESLQSRRKYSKDDEF